MKFVVWENGRNPEKNLPRPRFVHHETHMEWPRRELGNPAVGGERLTACATSIALKILNLTCPSIFFKWLILVSLFSSHNIWCQENNCSHSNQIFCIIIIIIIIRVFCPRAGPSLQTQKLRLQFCPKAGLPLQIFKNQSCNFTRDK